MNLPFTNGKWKVGVNGFADIVRTRNMDFNETGVAKLARQPIVISGTVDTVALGLGQAIVNDYVITRSKTSGSSGRMYLIDPSLGTATVQPTTDQPFIGAGSDMVSYINTLAASSDSTGAAGTVASFASGAWTAGRITGLTADVPHPLCVFENRNTLCVGNGNTIQQTTAGGWTIDSANSLTIPVQYSVEWMRWNGNNLYVGTRNTLGGSAKLFIWNGLGTSAQQGYPVNSDWV